MNLTSPPPAPPESPSHASPASDVRCGEEQLPGDLENCPRCGHRIHNIRWGQTNCPNCGLHFECC